MISEKIFLFGCGDTVSALKRQINGKMPQIQRRMPQIHRFLSKIIMESEFKISMQFSINYQRLFFGVVKGGGDRANASKLTIAW